MVNTTIFGRTSVSSLAPVADTVNAAGGKAYKFSDKHALAQIACTGTFNSTFYADAETNFKLAKEAADRLREDPEFIAKVAVYSREQGYMKDMPAYLTVVLSKIHKPLFRKVFRRVVNNGKMLANVIQIARSGAVGKTFNMTSGTWRNAIQGWFDQRSSYSIFCATVGIDISMKDILRMSRPSPNMPEKGELFAYLTDKKYEFEGLPQIVREYENYKKTKTGTPPNVDFRQLDSFMEESGWVEVARNAKWLMTLKNLNTFLRHNVFKNAEVTKLIADRLKNPAEIKNAGAFPYQLLNAFKNADASVPFVVRDALQEAMEIAVDNVPVIDGKVYIGVDVSGSMGSSVTGDRYKVKPSAVTCVDVAALFGASFLRKNKSGEIFPFDTQVHKHELNPRDSIMTNATALAKFGGGGTDCGVVLEHLNKQNAKGDAVIFISDYESWVDGAYSGKATKILSGWEIFSKRNKKARLVCIDVTPRDNSQVKQNRPNILQVGGFSDKVFDVVNSFLNHGTETDHWVSVIESIDLDAPLPKKEFLDSSKDE